MRKFLPLLSAVCCGLAIGWSLCHPASPLAPERFGAATRIDLSQIQPSGSSQGQSITSAGSSTAPVWGTSVLPRYVVGFGLTWTSTTTINFAGGSCSDSTNTTLITCSASSVITNAGYVETASQTGTLSTTSGSAAVVGSSTTFTTALNSVSTSGTVSNSGGTTVTGTGTAFLSEYAINDLIGTTALGFVQVTSIASNTSLTTAATTPGGALSASAPVKLEQPLIQCGAQAIRRVAKVTDNTHLTMGANSGTTVGSLAFTTGGLYPGDGANNSYYHLFATSMSGGTVYISTQRTKPLGYTAGTYSYFRRIGSFVADSAGNLLNFSQWGEGNLRKYRHEFGLNTNNTRIASNVNPSAWTTYQGSQAAPPSAVALTFTISDTNNSVSLRPANNGGGAGNNPLITSNGVLLQTPFSTKCDGAQQIQAFHASSAVGLYLDLAGWEDIL